MKEEQLEDMDVLYCNRSMTTVDTDPYSSPAIAPFAGEMEMLHVVRKMLFVLVLLLVRLGGVRFIGYRRFLRRCKVCVHSPMATV